MKIIKPYHEILTTIDGKFFLEFIEVCGRTCYKSEDRITEDSAKKFVAGIIKSGHHSVIEHVNITVRFVCDRGISHEIVRHRHGSYCQESSRYCNYSKDKFDNQITFILPEWCDPVIVGEWENMQAMTHSNAFSRVDRATFLWAANCRCSEYDYFELLLLGWRPEQARSVLTNSLKTEIVMTANLREWKHVFRMRCQKAAHPQIRELMLPLLEELHEKVPVVFDDDFEMFCGVNGAESKNLNIVEQEMTESELKSELNKQMMGDGAITIPACRMLLSPQKMPEGSGWYKYMIGGLIVSESEFTRSDVAENHYEMWECEMVIIPKKRFHGKRFRGYRIDQAMVDGGLNEANWEEIK